MLVRGCLCFQFPITLPLCPLLVLIKAGSFEYNYIRSIYNFPQIFGVPRMKFAEIPGRLNQLLFPPDPIIINHTISVEGVDQKKTSCYDIDVEVDDNLKVRCGARNECMQNKIQ